MKIVNLPRSVNINEKSLSLTHLESVDSQVTNNYKIRSKGNKFKVIILEISKFISKNGILEVDHSIIFE